MYDVLTYVYDWLCESVFIDTNCNKQQKDQFNKKKKKKKNCFENVEFVVELILILI